MNSLFWIQVILFYFVENSYVMLPLLKIYAFISRLIFVTNFEDPLLMVQLCENKFIAK